MEQHSGKLIIYREYLGLELTRYKSGNISSAKFNGETISNSEARRLEGTKCYVDVATKEVVCDREDLKQAAQEVIDDSLSKDKSPVLAQAETKKAAPKDDVVVTGDEFGKYEGLKELRAKAKAYYKEHLQGTSVHNSILGNVELKDDSIDFTGKGISKAVSTSAKENKLLLIKYLPQLIENANEVASQPNVKDKREAKQYTYLMTHAIVGGKRENVIVTIFTDANGNKYYNHILNDEENKKRPPVYPAQAANKSDGIPAMREPFSTSIIPQKAEKWNKPDEVRNKLSDGGKQAYDYALDKLSKGNEKVAQSAKENAQLIRSKEGLKAEIKEAFPNAKEIKDEGERMTFTMPNGSHIVVDLKNEILLTDKELAQAKKDHHIDDNGNVVVEGYAEVHGKDAYMALAQGSREGTGFHEAYHLAEGAVLTDREKAAIKKAIPDAEKRADKYAEWVEARKRGRGTAWGKLFQKIKDFAMKMKTILTGAETVHNVFRKIESGEVWERNANGQNSGRRYSVTKPKDVAEEVREKAEQDAENTVVTLNDILTEARKIVPIYTKSKVGEKSPAKYHYDARQRAGFVPESFDVGDIGSAIALHIDSIGEIKGANIELTKDIIEDRQMEQRNAKKYKSKVPTDISPSQARQEGVRNFGRLYFLDNERAKETYPQYYDLFEKALDGMPKEKAGVEKVLALQDQRVRQNPLLSAAAGISNGKPDSQLTWKERMKKRLLHLYAKMVDETDPIGQLTKALELETGAKIADEKDPHKRALMCTLMCTLMCNSVASARAFMLLDGDNRVANLKALNKVYKGAIKNKIRAGDLSIRHLVSNLYLVVVAGLSSIRLTP